MEIWDRHRESHEKSVLIMDTQVMLEKHIDTRVFSDHTLRVKLSDTIKCHMLIYDIGTHYLDDSRNFCYFFEKYIHDQILSRLQSPRERPIKKYINPQQETEDTNNSDDDVCIHSREYTQRIKKNQYFLNEVPCKKPYKSYTSVMSRTYIQKILIVAILEFIVVFSAFFLAYDLRLMRDWIPFIQLPIPYISYDQFIPFIWSGVFFWFVVFIR